MALDSQQNVDIIIVVRKQVLMFELCFLGITLHYQYYTTYLFFSCIFYHFTCLPILEGDIVRIANYDHDKRSSIHAWGKSAGSCDAKFKEKHQKKKGK